MVEMEGREQVNLAVKEKRGKAGSRTQFYHKINLFIYKNFPRGLCKITINEKIFKEEREANHFNLTQ